MPEWLARRRDLDLAEKLLLGLMRFRMGAAGECWWPHAGYAEDLGVSRQKVQRMLQKLVDSGVLEARLDNRRRFVVYRFGAAVFHKAVEAQTGAQSLFRDEDGAEQGKDIHRVAQQLSNGCPDLSNGCSPGEHKKKTEKRTEKEEEERQRVLGFEETEDRRQAEPVRPKTVEREDGAALDSTTQRFQRERRVGVCRCGFRGRPCWVVGEDVVAVEGCPRCHRVGYDVAQHAVVNG